MLVVFFCFFFKQKTAYEMRISDWSSDVCSSDLCRGPYTPRGSNTDRAPGRAGALLRARGYQISDRSGRHIAGWRRAAPRCAWQYPSHHQQLLCRARSEEHTSELQSLMRISYAVFCLKKKNKSPTK